MSVIITILMGHRLTERLKEKARQLGFSLVGIMEAAPGRRLAAYHRWLANDYHGQMGYMARPDRISRRNDLKLILPGVRSLVCVGLDYLATSPPSEIVNDPGRGRISNYAWGLDYHEIMSPRLEDLARWLQQEAGTQVSCKVYVDTGALLERDHAETAGLGFTGKNTMLIGPRSGSWLFLGELLTTAELFPDQLARSLPGCGSCTRCLQACPTAAFPEAYVLDARRCISYLTIELKGWIPAEIRPLMGNWVYGCDLCQEVCPFNRFAQPDHEPAFRPASWDTAAPPLLDLLALDKGDFDERFANNPIRRIKRQGLVRNACVAAGNWGDPKAIQPLTRLLFDLEPLIRGHAAWALGKIGGGESREALNAALSREDNDEVAAEMAAALATP